MPRPLTRPFRRVSAGLRTRRGLRGAAVATFATVAAALLTAGSQAPGTVGAARAPEGDGMSVPGGFVAPDAPLPDVPSQGDDSYHVELPPLDGVSGAERLWGEEAAKPSVQRATAEAGLPASVFAAYQRAAAAVGRTDPGCALPWELLAAIGKVESGHASGGAVAANGDTLTRITGPALDGNGFALILDSEGGTWDGDAVYDRAVGPMQFLPTTWKTWGADGNGDGISNPNNIHDAALAAGHYLCAGERDLGTAAGLERAILSYNYSRDYLNLVLGWMEFYLRGVHTVPDGTAVAPHSPGAGSDTPATEPVREAGGGDDAPDGSLTPAPATPTRPASPSSSPSPSASTSPTPTPTPSEPPAETEPPVPTPTETSPSPSPDSDADPVPSPSVTTPDPEPSTDPPASPSDSATPTPTETPEPTPSGTPTG
ncbi:lytic transglycosylase domain-containing protein [Streptomyces sp. NBC_00620]|uniref:lytic transglycosylase domain-containing protein n=1 Tax=Streptomyces sp. NBC_00620 TaxID=2903666 RepID=UPI0022586562|nr:hypothetical protein [Streptomyces sp. NBC_00620]MCX4971850.1 hypothetical protein [Streptomyces sp. NBC_00620]